MKWLTISEIKRRSKTAKGALKVSYEHWCQLYDATGKELRAEHERTKGWLVFSSHCGLCVYYGNKYGASLKCSKCIFRGEEGEEFDCGGGLWNNVEYAESAWMEGNGDWHTWKRACKALRDKLKELMEK